ncbi:hypothetical protein D3C81_1625000 [compost metagenome]
MHSISKTCGCAPISKACICSRKNSRLKLRSISKTINGKAWHSMKPVITPQPPNASPKAMTPTPTTIGVTPSQEAVSWRLRSTLMNRHWNGNRICARP